MFIRNGLKANLIDIDSFVTENVFFLNVSIDENVILLAKISDDKKAL